MPVPMTTRDDTMLARLRTLEAEARALEPEGEERERLRAAVSAYADRFLDALPDSPAYVEGDQGAGILGFLPREEPAPVEDLLALLGTSVDQPGINPASGRHLGYIPGGGVYTSALGDYLADVTNRYSGVFFASPGAVRMEHELLRWLAGVVGFPETSAGTLTSGGSIANLVAVVTARESAGLRANAVSRAVVYRSVHAHHCLDKALRIAGLGEVVVRDLPVDGHYRIRPDAAREQVQADRATGLVPWLLIASAGTTDTGSIDPLGPLADLAADEGLWYHVDGAYGALFALTDQGRERLAGMERADSLVLDPHKTLFLPYGTGVVLIRDPEPLRQAHRYHAHYMQDAARVSDAWSPADLSPELTRPFRGLRLWLPLHLHGLAPFRAALEEKLLLAQYAHRRLAEEGFSVGPEPDLSVVTFRWEAPRGDDTRADRVNRRILDRVLADGRVFLSSTLLDGRFTLRFAIVVHRTHRAEIDLALAMVSEALRASVQDLPGSESHES